MRRAGLRGLAALPRRVRTTDSRHGYPIAPNRIGRNFEAAAPNQVWLGDLTYVRTGEGWLYLAAVMDLHTRKIVGWSMRETLHAEIALEALDMAVQRQRPAPGLICHTDRGIQYACEPYREALAAAKITPSMSRKGNCLDNAPMESFFHSLKVERVHHRVYATRAEARRDLFAWIEGFYNTHRLHSALGYRSPAAMGAHGGLTASTEPGQDQTGSARAGRRSRSPGGSGLSLARGIGCATRPSTGSSTAPRDRARSWRGTCRSGGASVGRGSRGSLEAPCSLIVLPSATGPRRSAAAPSSATGSAIS